MSLGGSERKPRTYYDAIRDSTPKTEADIARRVAEKLTSEGWDVYPEVKLSEFIRGVECPTGVADLVAVQGKLALVCEAKKSFSLSLIEQAIEWTRIFPLVVAATPFAAVGHKTGLRDHLVDYFGIGLYSVSTNHVSYRTTPRLLRHNLPNVPKIAESLDERMKFSTAGASVTFRHTPYQDLVWWIRVTLAQHGPLPQKQLIDLVSAEGDRFHYASAASMRQQVRNAIVSYEVDLELDKATGLVSWMPDRCVKGANYVERVKTVAGGRQKPDR